MNSLYTLRRGGARYEAKASGDFLQIPTNGCDASPFLTQLHLEWDGSKKKTPQNPKEEKDSYRLSAVWELILQNRNALRVNNAHFLTLEVSCATKWTKSDSCLLFGDANPPKKVTQCIPVFPHSWSRGLRQQIAQTEEDGWGGRRSPLCDCLLGVFAALPWENSHRLVVPGRVKNNFTCFFFVFFFTRGG